MHIQQIKVLAEQGKYDEALAECDELLQSDKDIQILRLRAYVFALSGDYYRAILDRKEILEMEGASIGDYYLAADNAISAEEFETAARWLEKVLRLGEEQNEAWFASAAYFLLSYVQMELGEYHKAIQNLDRATAIEPDVALPLGSAGMCNHDQLRKEINRRATT